MLNCTLNARKTANANEQRPVTYDQRLFYNAKTQTANTTNDLSRPLISTRMADRPDQTDLSNSKHRSLYNHQQDNSELQHTGFGRLPIVHDLRSEFVNNSHNSTRNLHAVRTQSQCLRPLLSDAIELTCTPQQPTINTHVMSEWNASQKTSAA